MTVQTLHPIAGDDGVEKIRYLLFRKLSASNRHRTRVARKLKLRDNEMTAIIWLAERGALTPGQLGELISLTSGGVTALTQRLERLGYIERLPHPRDNRSCILRATPSIVERVAELFQPLVGALDELLAGLSVDDRRELVQLLDRLCAVTEHAADAITHGDDEPRASVTALWC